MYSTFQCTENTWICESELLWWKPGVFLNLSVKVKSSAPVSHIFPLFECCYCLIALITFLYQEKQRETPIPTVRGGFGKGEREGAEKLIALGWASGQHYVLWLGSGLNLSFFSISVDTVIRSGLNPVVPGKKPSNTSCRVPTGAAGLAAPSALSSASKLSAHLCSSAKGLRYISDIHSFSEGPLWPAGLPGHSECNGMDVGCQLFGVLSAHLGPGGGPKGRLWHDVHSHHDMYTHVTWPPFLLVYLLPESWKENGLDIPNKIKDHNDPQRHRSWEFSWALSPFCHHATGMISLPLLTQSALSP